MKHSTFSFLSSVCCRIDNIRTKRVGAALLSALFVLWGTLSTSAQSLSLSVTGSNEFSLTQSNDAGYAELPVGFESCASLEGDGWDLSGSTYSEFTWSNWAYIFGEGGNPAGCSTSLWTGGYLGGSPNNMVATRTVAVPANAGLLSFEYFSMLMDASNDGLDSSYIKINGNTVWSLIHTAANDTPGHIDAVVDISAYAGQTVTIEVSNNTSADNMHGNVLFSCFEILCSTCQPSLELVCAPTVTAECGSENNLELTGSPEVVANFCNGSYNVDLTYSDNVITINGCSKVITRTWIAVYGDLTATCTQIINVIDTQSPVIGGVEPVVTVECLENVPGPADATAMDACSGATSVVNFMSNTGELISHCDLSTAFGPGADWAIWLPTLSELGYASSAQFNFIGTGGFDQFNDGTAHLYGTVANSVNINEQFSVDFWFENAADWATWSSMGRGYKDDLGCAQPNFFNGWTYYEMVNDFSSLTGLGDFAGDALYFQHMPANYYFGMQVGQGANNKNCNFGLSAWFTFNGIMNGNQISGHGDVNTDASCEPNNEQDCANSTSFTYLYRAQDNCGHASIISQTILVDDVTAPTFVDCPSNVTIECSDAIPAVAAPSAVDNCVGDVVVTFLGEITEGNECYTTVTRTWSAEDLCGNRSNCVQVIAIVDTTAPVFNALPSENITEECSAVTPAAVLTATDNCADQVDVSFEETTTPGECPGQYTISRHWWVADNCQNVTHFYQTVNVVDTTAPTFDTYEYYTHIECDQIPAVITASDNCGSATVVVSFEEHNSGGCLGVLHRIYTATDECGNTATAEQYISIQDQTAPVINTPVDQTVECDNVPAMEIPTAYDNCGQEVTVTGSEEIIAGECANSYTIVRTWVATDYCENVATSTTTITVVDTTAPVFTEFTSEISVSCDSEIPAPMAVAADNCGSVSISSSDEIIAGDCPQAYTIVRTYTAIDECGNSSTLDTFINVYDNEAPTFTEGTSEMTIECDQEIPYNEPVAVDNCGLVSISSSDYDYYTSDCYSIVVRVFTATDECGNYNEYYQYIYIQDTTAPVFNAYEIEISLPCDNYEGQFVTATDNCNEVEITHVDEFVSGGCAGRIIRTYTATDVCGNNSSVQQIITMVDEIAPVASFVPANQTVECGQGYEMGSAEFTDNCDNELEVSQEITEAFDGCTRVFTYTWTAVDHCNNTTVESATVTIVDTTNPTWEFVPADITIECDQEIPAVEMAIAVDNCDDNVEVAVTEMTAAGDCPQSSTITRIFRGFDNCGNEVMAVQYIYIVDTTAPVFTSVAPNVTIECSDEVPAAYATATDNCGDATVEVTESTEGNSCYTVITRNYVATDACGNMSYASQTITIVDTTAPVFNAFSIEIERPCDNYEGVFVSATDNCNEVEITYTDEHVSGGCQGRIIRNYMAIDACQNVSYAQQIITLTDETAPVVVEQPADMTYECSNNEWSYAEVSFTDNCAEEVSVDFNVEYTPNGCLGFYTATWTAVDNCGNTTVVDQVITIVDTIDPEFTFVPANYTAECSEELVLENATASDDCSSATVAVTEETIAGNCPNTYTLVRTFTATDNCGNTATASQEITVVDTTAPVWNNETAVSELSFECDEVVASIQPTATDNCNVVEYMVAETLYVSGPCYTSGAYIFTAVDACGNVSAPFYQYYTIVDTTAPVVAAYDVEVDMPCDQVNGNVLISATDNCNEVTITFNDEYVSGGCQGRIIRDYTITDACENTTYAQQIITLIDVVDPIAEVLPENLTIECGSEIPSFTPAWSDNCDEELELSAISGISMDGCNEIISRSWTAVDNCGNSTTISQMITIVDTTAPSFEYVPADYTSECSSELSFDMASAWDICDENVTVEVAEETVQGSCAGNYSIVRTFTATDACGNFTVATQTITVVDTTAPEFTFVPANSIVNCEDYNGFMMATAADLCSDAEVTFVETSAPFFQEGSTVDCGQLTTFSIGGWGASNGIGANYRDTHFAAAFPNGLTVGCGNNTYTFTSAQAIENFLPAGGPVSTISGNTTNPTGVQNQLASQLVAAELSLGFDANDANFAASTNSLGSAVYNNGPFSGMTVAQVIAHANLTLGGCSNAYSLGSLAEALAMLNLNYDGEGVDNGNFNCGSTEEICGTEYTRVWTATDACGNFTNATTTIVVYDNVAPTFNGSVSNVTVECASEIPAFVELTATDACGTVTVTRTEEVLSNDDCGNQVIEVNYAAVDNCGNAAYTSYTITVLDETAPVLSSTPANLVLACDQAIPAAEVVTALDNCNGEVEVMYTETYIGEQPEEGSIADCDILTPALPEGNPCGYPTAWAMALFNMPSAHRFYVVQSGELVQFANGTQHLVATLVNAYNSNAGFNVDVTFANAQDWAAWSSQNFPTSFKADCGGEGVNHQDWIYSILQNGPGAELTGWGAYAGSSINLTHAPSSNYFGFQLGDGANNYSGVDNGFGGWFTYNGTFVNGTNEGTTPTTSNVNGGGDFAFELDCCPDYQVVRCWTAMDCSGNTVEHCQTISFEGSSVTPAIAVETSTTTVADSKESIISVYPNPAVDQATFVFKAAESGKTMIEIYDLAGARIAMIYSNVVEAGAEYSTTYDASKLATGVYMYRMTNGSTSEMGRMIINK